jgi:hypothetical protein
MSQTRDKRVILDLVHSNIERHTEFITELIHVIGDSTLTPTEDELLNILIGHQSSSKFKSERILVAIRELYKLQDRELYKLQEDEEHV